MHNDVERGKRGADSRDLERLEFLSSCGGGSELTYCTQTQTRQPVTDRVNAIELTIWL